MPDRNGFYFPDLDLVPPTEALRRRLYDAAVQVAFTEAPGEEDFIHGIHPDDCGFQVVYVLGRWFAFWRDLEAETDPTVPLSQRLQLVRIHADQDRPEGIHFSEV